MRFFLLCPDGSGYSYAVPVEQLILIILLPVIIAALILLICFYGRSSLDEKELRRLYETYSLCRTVCKKRAGCKLCIIDDIAEILGEERRG